MNITRASHNSDDKVSELTVESLFNWFEKMVDLGASLMFGRKPFLVDLSTRQSKFCSLIQSCKYLKFS